MTKFVKAKVIGSDWVTVLYPTKKEAKVLKDKAIPLGIILYIGKDFESTTAYYQVGSKTVAVQVQSIPHYEAEKLMASYPDDFVHGYIKSDTIFPDEEVLIDTALLDYGLYTIEEDTSEDCVDGLEEDTSEDCSDGSEEDTSEDEEDTLEDYSDILELCQHEEEDTEEDTEEDYSSGLELCPHEEEDTSIKGEDTMKFINGKLDINDCGDDLELCPHKEEDTSEDYIETANVCGVEIKNHCTPFSETMLVHEAVEQELIDFLGDLNLERWELFDSDIDCTLCLDEQYNNMVTGFIVFGAILGVFASDVKYSRDYYLGYMARSYNLRNWEIKELANLIDLGINLDSSVIEPDSLTLQDCLKSFVGAVHSYIRFETKCYLDYEQVVEKLQTGGWFDRVAKFYLTLVCWGKFKPASCIDDDDNNIDYYDYPSAIWYYNVNLGLFDGYDMSELLLYVADDFNITAELVEKLLDLDNELIKKYIDLDVDLVEAFFDRPISIDTAINILDYWRNHQNKKFKVFPYNEQIKLKVLAHVIRKLKGVH